LPTNAVSLTGSATDAENNPLTYAWTSAPADGVTFANAAAGTTQATFTTAGTYTLTLTANDGTTTGTDALVVTVNAAPVTPPPTPTASWPGPDLTETDPNYGWEAAAPGDVGMDAARLLEAETFAKRGGGAGMVTRYGKLVHKWEETVTDGHSATPHVHNIDYRIPVKSTTKSIGGIALGLAIDAGLVKLEDTAKTVLPTIGVPPDSNLNLQAQLDAITILNLATHTAGFVKPASPPPPLNYGPPGTKFVYSDGGLNWLGRVLTVAHNRDLSALLTEKVWQPLGITTDDLLWSEGDPIANPTAGGPTHYRRLASDIVANPNAMARIGLLYMRKGMWKDTRILSETSVQLASTPRPETAGAKVEFPDLFPNAHQNYGLLWWTNANKQLAEVPADAYWAWGLDDSLIIVIPSLDIVVTRVGREPDSDQAPHWRTKSATDTGAYWDGNYEAMRGFIVPIVQSVTATP
jgi:CubicO group peptidase (beta-lactamase class C family)